MLESGVRRPLELRWTEGKENYCSLSVVHGHLSARSSSKVRRLKQSGSDGSSIGESDGPGFSNDALSRGFFDEVLFNGLELNVRSYNIP